MAVSPQDVKKLREQTGAGMLDCKKALQEANGDFAEAEKVLRKQGLASAARRSDRQTSEGAVFFAQNDERLVMVELRCETDFVSMNEEFRKLGAAVAEQALAQNLYEPTEGLVSKVQEAVLKLKENLNIGNVVNISLKEGDSIASYSHNNGAIGAAVVLHREQALPEGFDLDDLHNLGHSLAMHAAAYQPAFLDSSHIDAKLLADQEDIFRERAEKEQIPEKAREGYVKGQLKKWRSECCFVDQGFVKEPKKTVAKVVQEFSAQSGFKLSVKDYRILKVGA